MVKCHDSSGHHNEFHLFKLFWSYSWIFVRWFNKLLLVVIFRVVSHSYDSQEMSQRVTHTEV
jgi:hypothetical protein